MINESYRSLPKNISKLSLINNFNLGGKLDGKRVTSLHRRSALSEIAG
jgi:hypothetical protein